MLCHLTRKTIMATIAPTAPCTIHSIHDPRIKEKLQELRRTDNTTNIYYFVRTYLYFALVIGGALWFFHYQASAAGQGTH